jgi:formate-dependent nitrite reductase membrane component NrfD
MVYTGVLLSASPNPLWSTVLLPVVFVASAMATGVASVIFILALLGLCGVAAEESPVPKLEKLNSWIIAFQLVVVIVFMLVRIGSAQMISIIGAGFGPLWWIGVIGLGLAVPFALTRKGGARRPLPSLILSALVLLGGFLLRYVILVAGQMA